MIHRIKQCYPHPEKDNINLGLMRREYEDPIELYVVKGFQSITDVIPEITMTNWTFQTDIDSVDQSSYERTRSNKRSDKEQKFINVEESRMGELVMNFHVDVSNYPEEIRPDNTDYSVRLLIPIPDEDGKYLIRGIKYYLHYQLTEATTYITSNALVTKSLMGIKVKKDKLEVRDHEDNIYVLNCFKTNMFNGYIPAMYFFLAEYGWYDTLEFFSVGHLITITQETEKDPEYTYFRINSSLFLKVPKSVLLNDYVQAIVGSLMGCMNPRISMEDVMDKKTWIAKIGSSKKNAPKESHYELGTRYRILYTRMYDRTSRETYQLTMHNKDAILNIVRWMIQEHTNLRQKDNLNILNKRLRGTSYVSSLVDTSISDHIKKYVNTTVNTKDKLRTKLNTFFNYRGTEIISKMHKSGLVRYNDIVNDMDAYQRFKCTMKGPNSIGNKNSRNVSVNQRALHPSHIGILDLGVCSASEPGLTNYINPLTKTDGLYFMDRPPEPETFYYEWMKSQGYVMEYNDPETGAPILSIVDPVAYNDVADMPYQIRVQKIIKERIPEEGTEPDAEDSH